MQSTIRDIRKQLRLAMNGIVSTSMREKGMNYKMNFGVSLPQLREIANKYKKDTLLAEALWQEDVRELKILAALLYPIENFTPELAESWVLSSPNQEIIEQLSFHLLSELPYAVTLATKWICKEEKKLQIAGYLLLARLCTKNVSLRPDQSLLLLTEGKKIIDTGDLLSTQAVLTAFKRFGRQSADQGTSILTFMKEYESSDLPVRQEIYADLQFEFDYSE